MQDLSVSTTDLPEILAAVATGDTVRLMDGVREVAVVTPPTETADQRTVEGLFARLRRELELDKYGMTDDEIEAMRDRSPGPPPISFG